MNSWRRIILVSLVLIGGTMYFGFWSISQFNDVFDNLSNVSVTNTLANTISSKENTALPTNSTELSESFPTSTNGANLTVTSTTTIATSTPATSTPIEIDLSFIFPKKDVQIYIGCTYNIAWHSSTTVNSLGIALVDAGTGKSMGPVASGVAKENTIGKDSQNLEWKIGVVWPGEYYLRVSKINGIEKEFRSKVFEINKMPEGLDEKERNNICTKSID